MTGTLLPFPIHETTLDNGLRVIVVSTGFPNIVSLQIPVKTGSRNEVEPGKSGFAHFFEHMMFRGTERFPPDDYSAIIAKAGARQNAYTTDDYTNYHITFAAEDLETLLDLEADRFMNLKYAEEGFKTESRAILGEYNRGASDPMMKLFEVQRSNAFSVHPYEHTTMGFLADIENMPNQYDYSLSFFKRWYRPEYTTVLLAGDLEPEPTVKLVEKYWGQWKPGSDTPPTIPQEPDPTGTVLAHVPWTSPTMPWVTVAFRGPAFRVDDPSMAALDMLYDLWFGETSDLYRELVEVDQVVDRLYPWVLPTEDPSLATVLARVKDYANLLPVRDRILSILARARSEEVPTDRLRDAQAYARYSLLRSFDNSEAIASNLARFVRFDRSTRALEALFEQYEALTPKALLEAGQRFIRDDALVLTTLSEEPQPAEEEGPPSLKTLFTKPALLDESSMVVASSPTPQLLMKVQFLVGSADDPEGKEGLAAMAAMMIAEGGSIEMRADKITKALLPMAGSHSAQVDLEMTTFTWIVHADNFDRFAEIVLGQLLSPGYRGDDFDRIKDQQRNALVQDLRSNNDEEFGKEVLQSIVFAGTPYGHPTLGTVSGINSIALADIREFVEANFTQARLVLGLSGSFPDGAVDRLRAELARLPGGDSPSPVTAPVGAQPAALEVEIVEKDTRSVAFSFGHPIDVLRDHPDFPALWLARATLGDHRAFGGRLFLRIREVRGINYGDYAYIEAFPGGMYRFFPQPNRARRAQLFEVWIRPVQPEQAVFALKLALHEVEKFIEGGLDDDEFERVHGYLLKNIYVMLQSQDAQLGYDLDGRWFGTGEFTAWMRKSLEGLTRKRVNEAIRRHLSAERLTVAVITGDAKGLKEQLLDSADAVMNYDAPRDESLLAEDKIVGARPLGLTPERIRIRSSEDVFR